MTAEMVGSASVSCTDSRSWSQSPQCNQKCLPILDISHGNVEYQRTNRIVTHTIFTCDRGYEIVGNSILRCLPSNQWSHETPVCQELDPCVSTPCQNNGECMKVDGISYTCTCQQNYRGDNCETVINPCFNNPCQNGGTCTQNGQDYQCTCQGRFEGPNCENVKRCPDMNLSPGVRTTPGSSFTVGGSARFQCSDTNKVLSGNQELNCLSDQTWDRSPPTCVVPAGMCPELLAPLNGNLILRGGTSRNVGATYRYRCNEGFNLKGDSSYIVCSEDHTWSLAERERPRCIVPGCTIFLLPSGVSLPQGEHPVGRQLTVVCSGNQVLRGGPPGIVCRGRNVWSTPISSYSCSPQ